MLDKNYIDKLIEKYSYDSKTINALSKILPQLIEYYGEEYEETILDAVYNCEIIACNSYQTITKVEKEKELTKTQKTNQLKDINLKRNDSTYLTNIKISYDELTNTFNIDKIKRTIVTAHTFNYDSPKGLEVLTYALCKLVKSYEKEYEVKENKLIRKTGLAKEEMLIIKEKDDIYLVTEKETGIGLEEGLTIYDTEQIVSMVLKDKYKCYDYDSVYTVAQILKEKFKLLDLINYAEITKDDKELSKICSEEEKLKTHCDECLKLEHEMFISMQREEKNELAKQINNKLTKTIYKVLIETYENYKKDKIKNNM